MEESDESPTTAPLFCFTLQIPTPICSLHFGSGACLFAGSEDGFLRVYRLPHQKFQKAIKGLAEEISSIYWQQINGTESGHIWLASGARAILFDLESPKMIISADDAKISLQLGEDSEDVLNELTLNRNGTHLAFSTDAGTVGVVELSTRQVSRMKTRHQNICGSVKFIPDRPSEIVSGGYDSALLHFDFVQGHLLSRFDVASVMASSGVSLSPPFILTVSLSSTGLIAAGTADGRVWISAAGEKRASVGKKKRNRKWEGLKDDEGLWISVAEGPIVAVSFIDVTSLLTCTLMGTITQHLLTRTDGELSSTSGWSLESKDIEKVNAVAAEGDWLVVGGFDKHGKGLAEIWNLKGEAASTNDSL